MAAFEEQAKANMAMFQKAMQMWAPFAQNMQAMPGAIQPLTPKEAERGADTDDDQLAELRKQMAAMQKQLDAMARKN
jgi:polyhydroxyalkanoate synthesis regulator protein